MARCKEPNSTASGCWARAAQSLSLSSGTFAGLHYSESEPHSLGRFCSPLLGGGASKSFPARADVLNRPLSTPSLEVPL